MKILVVFGLLWACVSAEVMVHLFEWRYNDIAEECHRFLAPYGYDAVQVSPVNENIALDEKFWFERYQPVSYKTMTRSGDEEAFIKMVAACNKEGIKIYVDLVFNHMTKTHPRGTKTSGKSKKPPDTANKDYPDVPYNKEHFHDTCKIENTNDVRQLRECELDDLHDLNQSHPHVQKVLVTYINKLVDIGVAGFRLDAAKHMTPDDLERIYGQVHNLNPNYFKEGRKPYFYHEVMQNAKDPDSDVIKPGEYFHLGRAFDFKFSYEVSRAFEGKNALTHYKNFGENWRLLPQKNSIVFVDNHDTQRYGHNYDGDTVNMNYKKDKTYKMAVAFMLAWPHESAQVMSSYVFDDIKKGPPMDEDGILKMVNVNENLSCKSPRVCEHRWRQIYNMVHFAKVVGAAPIVEWWSNNKNQIAFAREKKGFIAFNMENNKFQQNLQTTLPPGVYCNLASGVKMGHKCTGEIVTVDAEGMAAIEIEGLVTEESKREEHLEEGETHKKDGFLAIHIGAKLS